MTQGLTKDSEKLTGGEALNPYLPSPVHQLALALASAKVKLFLLIYPLFTSATVRK